MRRGPFEQVDSPEMLQFGFGCGRRECHRLRHGPLAAGIEFDKCRGLLFVIDGNESKGFHFGSKSCAENRVNSLRSLFQSVPRIVLSNCEAFLHSGHLKIAEIESRFDNVNAFIQNIQGCGFKLMSKDVSTKVFYFLYFKKTNDAVDYAKAKDFALKPCLYKKR